MVKGTWVSDAVQLEFAENWDWNNKIQAKREALTANSMVFYSHLDYKSCPYNILIGDNLKQKIKTIFND